MYIYIPIRDGPQSRGTEIKTFLTKFRYAVALHKTFAIN